MCPIGLNPRRWPPNCSEAGDGMETAELLGKLEPDPALLEGGEIGPSRGFYARPGSRRFSRVVTVVR